MGLIWADAQAYADAPDKVIGRVSTYGVAPIDDVDSVRYNVIEMMRRARKDVVITSPYLIPGESGLETFRNSVQRYGVKYTLVTNSLAATDEPVVHTGYRRYRPEMLKLGMNLYELSPQKVSRSLRLGRFSTSIGRLHAKSAVVDKERVFIGSMNFDPRSDQHNTEMGLFIQSPQLAQQVLKLVEVIRQQGAYKVTLAENGKDLVWTTTGPGGQEHGGRGARDRRLVAHHARGAVGDRARRPAVARPVRRCRYCSLIASTWMISRTASSKPNCRPHRMSHWLRRMLVSKSPPQTSRLTSGLM